MSSFSLLNLSSPISSRDIPLKPDTSSDFGYSVNDARLYANKHTMSPASLHYGQHPGAVDIGGLPGTAEDPLMAQYGRGYACGHDQAPPPTSHKQYFPAIATYASAPNPYGDPTAVGVGSRFANYTAAGYRPVHAMGHKTVGMVPSWSSRKTTPYGGVYMDSAPESYGGYAGTGTSRSSLPYAGGTAMKTSSQPGVSSPPANVAASATAYGGFDGLPASYGSASTHC
ncbi:hypothetical protein N0V85_008707 [Neurospora sp. IMI 360204]|nr:hypothetical protein N0V85_008707 [Neurospora sp. IMI 360204]